MARNWGKGEKEKDGGFEKRRQGKTWRGKETLIGNMLEVKKMGEGDMTEE